MCWPSSTPSTSTPSSWRQGTTPAALTATLPCSRTPPHLDRFKATLAQHGAGTASAAKLPRQPSPSRSGRSPARPGGQSQDHPPRWAKLGVTEIVDFSGCPGDSPTAKAPNWVTCPWPPEYLDVLAWQWDKVVAPYWIERAKFASDHGVRVAIEMHPGFVVYNPETLLRLRSIAGPSIGCNYDPSHMFWQGIDPIAAIRVLGDAIFHVHAKDTQIYAANLPRTGVLDTKPYTDERNRGWIFRTCGYGHGAEWWKEFVSTLRMFGYDNVLSIEHEDSLMSPEEGLTKAAQFLNEVLVKEKPTAAWWV